MTDENHDRSVGFGDGDRMPLAIVVGKACGHFLACQRAGPEHRREAGEGADKAQRAIAIEMVSARQSTHCFRVTPTGAQRLKTL